MNIYTKDGNLAFKFSNFPDGQPHFELSTYDTQPEVTIETAIRSCEELVQISLVREVLSRFYSNINLDIRYMLGARMDRFINDRTPSTLCVLTNLLHKESFHRIRILDPHSITSLELLNAGAVLPVKQVWSLAYSLGRPANMVIVSPDKGATARVNKLAPPDFDIIQCLKTRDSETGKLSDFQIVNPKDIGNRRCLIVDDICDGGRTFTGIAKRLRSHGASAVFLYVTHGIFSAGTHLQDIDGVYTTDSYEDWSVYPKGPVCIPILMKDMR